MTTPPRKTNPGFYDYGMLTPRPNVQAQAQPQPLAQGLGQGQAQQQVPQFAPMGIAISAIRKNPPKVIRNNIPNDPELMETKVLMAYNPSSGLSWNHKNGKWLNRSAKSRKVGRKAYRKAYRKASRKAGRYANRKASRKTRKSQRRH
jgi:hypothetical protein